MFGKNHQSVSLTEPFIFMSPFRSVYATGCFTQITTPAEETETTTDAFQQTHRQEQFHHAISTAFDAARKSGITAPLLAGAIPFDSRQNACLFIPQQYHWLSRADCLQQLPAPDSASLPQISHYTTIPSQEQFLRTVRLAADICQSASTELEKIVLARLIDVQCSSKPNSMALMARLAAQNPDSFNFHIPLADGGILMGASPELLLRKIARQLYSMPLAGSARRDSDALRDKQIASQLLHSAKDRHEHQIVISAIRQQLAPQVRQLTIADEPILISTPALWHLATPVSAICDQPTEIALTLACLLHPTPALSGFPHHIARQLISELEPFDRQLFGGIVGWCDDQGNGEWVVAIRCAHILAHRVRFFAGAGIVANSSPMAEWQETETKLRTMLQVFGMN